MKAPVVYTSPWYDVAVAPEQTCYKLILINHTNFQTTKYLPNTFDHLSQTLPSILKAYCRNDDNLPFYQEMRATEIGHLFEHILLEYACIQKLQHGFQKCEFEGRTDWNWQRDLRGIFHITIEASPCDWQFIESALPQTHETMMALFRGADKADSRTWLSA